MSTVLIFVVIPAAIVLVIAALSNAGGDRSRPTKRYRPGRPYDFAPIWLLAAPERVDPALGERAPDKVAHAPAIEAGIIEDAAGHRVLPDRWEAQVTVGEAHDRQPAAALEEPGGPTISAEPELTTSPAGLDALDGPFTTRQLLRLDEALRVADQQTGLTYSVYVGELAEPVRESAEKLHKQIDDSATAILVAVSPNQRVLEIVTGHEARKRVSDRDAKLAALSMAASFAGGDLAGGVLSGLDQLATHAGKH